MTTTELCKTICHRQLFKFISRMPFHRCASVCEHRVLRCCDINYLDASGQKTQKTLLIKLGLQFSGKNQKNDAFKLTAFLYNYTNVKVSLFYARFKETNAYCRTFSFHLGKLPCCVI